MTGDPYRSGPQPDLLSHDERLRRETNEKLSAELVKMAAAIRERISGGWTTTGDVATYERMAKVLKERGI